MFKNLIVIFILVGGCTTTANQKSTSGTWILPTVETHPEERTVADSYPVEPVVIEKLF
jgi:hypothetical protein